ncbi:MAG: hypothetical protein O7A63_01330 [Acidobacteria bacterium]|nr:hypothetical protein [Acidobacteriota bacterium]
MNNQTGLDLEAIVEGITSTVSNDVSPSGFNDGSPPKGLWPSPLPPALAPTGYAWDARTA